MKYLILISAATLTAAIASAQPDSLWSRSFGGLSSDWCSSVQQTEDGNYVFAGTSWSVSGGPRFWMVKTTAEGDSLWSRAYG